MPLSDFKVVESVGKGSFASVYKVMRKSDKQLYALKRVKIGKMSKREIQDALNEIRFLASIRHRNVVGFLEAFLGEPPPSLSHCTPSLHSHSLTQHTHAHSLPCVHH
jgi:NIMA (never in mitosis gene a)-related kinase